MNRIRGRIAVADRELHFLRGNKRRAIRRSIEHPRDGTEVTAGPNEHRRHHTLVHDPAAAMTTYVGDASAELKSGLGTLQKIVIELAASDAEAYGPAVTSVPLRGC